MALATITATSDFVPELEHPRDLSYRAKFESRVHELLKNYTEPQLKQLLRTQQRQKGPRDEDGTMTRRIIGELYGDFTPTSVKNILGPNSGTNLSDGSALVRQDLDATIHALYIRSFPLWEFLKKVPSNGLVYAYDVTTSPDPNMTATSNTISTVVTDLATVPFTTGVYARQTSNIAVFALGRGASFKEMAAVRAGGMAFSPIDLELAGGATKIAYDLQTMIIQGNATFAGGTASSEAGAYNGAYFDGMRQIMGSVAGTNYANNGASQIDQASLNITESLQTGLAKSAQLGGMPKVAVMSMIAKQKLDIENQNNKRYNDVEDVIPGLRANKIAWANGDITILAVPGFSFGSYNRSSDNVLVEDIYFFDPDQAVIPWLFSENLTTIELPDAVDFTLSSRYILMQMAGFALREPLFSGKVRISL